MALNTLNRTSLSFKKLFGKAHTQQGFSLASEGISSNMQIANTTIFGQTINPLPVTDLGLSTTGSTDGIVEKVRFEIDIIPDTFIGPNQSQGYRLKLPSGYVGNLSDDYSGGTYLHEALGKLQIVPSLYGTLKSDGTTEYDPLLLDTNENIINKFDAINWNLDPYNGILFVQDPPSNYDISSNRPAFLEAYLYVGSFLDNQSGDKLQRNIVQNNHGFERGTVISYSGGSFIRALSIEGQPEVIGIVSQSGSTNNFTYISSGYFEDISGIEDQFGNPLSGETVYYLSDDQPGKLIPNEPVSVGDIVKPILYVLNTNTNAQVLPYRGNIVSTGSTGSGTGVVSVQNVGGGVPVGVTSSGTSTVELRTFEGLNGIDVTQNGNLVELNIDLASNSGLGFNSGQLEANVANGLSKVGNNIVLGGSLTGDTNIDTSTNNISISDSGVITTTNISNSIFGGQNNLISGTSKYSSIINGLSSCVVISHANTGWNTVFGESNRIEGNRINNSIFGGYNNCMCNTTGSMFNGVMFGSQNAMSGTSQIIGGSVIIGGSRICTNAGFTIAGGLCAEATGQGSIALGFDTTANDNGFGSAPNIIASGIRAINISSNNASQIQGHGALSDQSVILGGLNNHIDTGNTRAVIIGGEGIKLTGGTSYSGHTVVGDLAIYNEPTSGNSTQILTRNETTGIVEYTSSSEFGGETITVNNGLTKIGSNIVLGGTLTGNTTINTNGFGVAIGTGTTISNNHSFAQGINALATGTSSIALAGGRAGGSYSISIGQTYNSCLVGDRSVVIGHKAVDYGNSNTISIGYYAYNSGGNNSIAIGKSAYTFGGCNNLALGYSAAINNSSHGLAIGNSAKARANYSIAIGCGAQVCNNAMNSITFGNNNILQNNCGAVLIGGSGRTITNSNYNDHVIISNLAIETTPSGGTSGDTVLVRDGSTGIIKELAQSGLTTTKGELIIDHTGTTLNLNFSDYDYIKVNLASDITGLTLSNTPLRQDVITEFFQSGSTGNYSPPSTLPSEIKTVDGVDPDWSFTSGTTTVWIFNEITNNKILLTSLANIQ